MAQAKDFYDYQMAVDYVTAKEKGDTKRVVELQHQTYGSCSHNEVGPRTSS